MNNDPRHCFLVKRYHTWTTIQQQNVGEHTCQILRIFTEVFGPPGAEVTQAILWHDGGELWTGDVPFDAKRESPQLKDTLSDLDLTAVKFLSAGRYPTTLPQEDRDRVKVCDLLEMWEFSQMEVRLGNTHYGAQIGVKVLQAAHELAAKLSHPDRDSVYSWIHWRETL